MTYIVRWNNKRLTSCKCRATFHLPHQRLLLGADAIYRASQLRLFVCRLSGVFLGIFLHFSILLLPSAAALQGSANRMQCVINKHECFIKEKANKIQWHFTYLWHCACFNWLFSVFSCGGNQMEQHLCLSFTSQFAIAADKELCLTWHNLHFSPLH